ncbi:MAG: hypothetical protein WAN03_04030 [Candidatus Sulfotelmatobacter sp.]
MPHVSYTAEGFRATFRYPSVTLAEIAWRWAVGGTASALLLFCLLEYTDTLPVTGGDLLFLRTRHPYLVGQAIAHIFRGSFTRLSIAMLVGGLLLTLLWTATSAIGRLATVHALLDYFREQFRQAHGSASGGQRDIASNVSTDSLHTSALFRLNFLRAATGLAAGLAIFGAAILAGFASPDGDPAPGVVFVLFLFLAGLVWLAWIVVNWTLSLAGLFAVREGAGAIDAISAAVTLCRERAAAVFTVSAWTGLAHITVFVATAAVASLPLGFAAVVPWRLIVLAMLFITLMYFAVVDWLYMARLAGYVCIAETPEILAPPPSAPIPPVPPIPVQTAIDRNELILSDVLNLAVERALLSACV